MIATYLSMNDRRNFSKKKTEGKYFQTLQIKRRNEEFS